MMLTSHLDKENEDLLQFSQLDVSFKGIRIINKIPVSLRFISKLYIAGNYLLSLKGIEQFYNLQVLHLDYNLISVPSQLTKINNPFFVQQLSFIANPIYQNKQLTKQYLKQQGFTRLQILNPCHHLVYKKMQHKYTKNNDSMINTSTQMTTRRKPKYKQPKQELQTSRKKMIGKLYYNKAFKTKRQNSNLLQNQQLKQTQHHTKQTRQSTSKPSLSESPIPFKTQNITRQIPNAKSQITVTPFEANPVSERTAKFQQEQENGQLGEQFIEQQKQHLANCFYKRVILQKCFKALTLQDPFQSLKQSLKRDQGKLLNNNMETAHFGLIKLRHQLLRTQ